nr:alpha/beta hydrolase [Ancylobacter crimeensis]
MDFTPPWTLSAQEARRQPTPADGARQVIRRRGLDPDDDLGVRTRDITIPGPAGPIKARVYTPEDEPKDLPVVVYFHGGGFVIADLDTYDSTPRALAKETGCVFVSCSYRQGPENKFPAAHEDAWAAWRWVAENADRLGGAPDRLALVGESAGGNLALNVAIRARDQGGVQARTVILVYPLAGNDLNTPSYIENADAEPLNKPFMEWFVKNEFASPAEAADPRINLVTAQLHDLPPVLIIAAGIDPLRSEGELLARRLEQAGVDVSYQLYPDVAHEFFGMGLLMDAARDAEGKAASKLNKELGHGLMGKIAKAFT